MKRLGRGDEAADCFRRAVALRPTLAEAHNNLGVLAFGRGDIEAAIVSYRRAVELAPGGADGWYNLAIASRASGEIDRAIDSCRAAIARSPRWPEAHNNLGIWLTETGRAQEAIAAFDAALEMRADYAEALCNRADALRQAGRVNEGIDCLNRAIALRPDFAEALNNLGGILKQAGRMDEATAALNRALSVQPTLAEAHNNLGNVLKDTGQVTQAVACYERAAALALANAPADSNRIYTLHFHPDYSAGQILDEHRRWDQRHARPLASEIRGHGNLPFPRRRLRIGYVSPDFREHCQAMFTMPLLSNHDRDRFEIYCYSDVTSPDDVTNRLRGLADAWRPIAGVSDQRVAEQVRADGIDILVDLTMHLAHHRLLVFARKPAPVQVTWLGYPGTTGLAAMDYRLSDPWLDPPDQDRFYTERTIRLPDSFWCYDPLSDEPAVNALPASVNGHVTFGCLNNFCKVNSGTLELWARVLAATPRSRLLLLAPEGSTRQRVLQFFKSREIEADRIDFAGRRPRRNYLELYHRIDIGLDTIPYNGHTTSLDSYWMGVPVVTLIGKTAVGRGGWSQLNNLGLSELAADSREGFVRLACALAEDQRRLGDLRSTLRQRLADSPLMDAARFARTWNRRLRACGRAGPTAVGRLRSARA